MPRGTEYISVSWYVTEQNGGPNDDTPIGGKAVRRAGGRTAPRLQLPATGVADTVPGGAGVEDSATIDLADEAGTTGVEHPGF